MTHIMTKTGRMQARSPERARCAGFSRTLLLLGLVGAAALVSGCNALHGLGTDLQSLSDLTESIVFVEDPARD